MILGGEGGGEAWVGRSGFLPGYGSEMRFYPGPRIAIAIQFNADHRAQLGVTTSAYPDAIRGLIAPATPADPGQGKPGAPIRKSGN